MTKQWPKTSVEVYIFTQSQLQLQNKALGSVEVPPSMHLNDILDCLIWEAGTDHINHNTRLTLWLLKWLSKEVMKRELKIEMELGMEPRTIRVTNSKAWIVKQYKQSLPLNTIQEWTAKSPFVCNTWTDRQGVRQGGLLYGSAAAPLTEISRNWTKILVENYVFRQHAASIYGFVR